MITERLLQFIWQYQYYNTDNLFTCSQEPLVILRAGLYNENQGPDFLDARISIGGQVWIGNIELHISSEDWYRHMHDDDPNYGNVILHVVWSNSGRHPPGIATLEVQDRVSVVLLDQYRQWMSGVSFIPCGRAIGSVPALKLLSWKERLVAERLERKAKQIFEHLSASNFYWEETLWWMIARNFGVRVNAEAFEAMARTIPYHAMLRHREELLQVEALFFGQAGLLEGKADDEYVRSLKTEYRFLSRKYGLKRIMIPVYFLRMRPSSFPTLRLAQLAMLIHTHERLLDAVLNGSLKSLYTVFDIRLQGYWLTHYVLGKEAQYEEKRTGDQLIEGIVINVIIPFLFAYGKHFNNLQYCQRAEEWLYSLASEKNHIITAFEELGMSTRNAADSQFLLELKGSYCAQWMCLDCAIGNHLLKAGS